MSYIASDPPGDRHENRRSVFRPLSMGSEWPTPGTCSPFVPARPSTWPPSRIRARRSATPGSCGQRSRIRGVPERDSDTVCDTAEMQMARILAWG